MIKKIFFALSFVSGFCALLYQTVWLRLAFANFGINAQVISIVISIFMLGLVLGSWLSGRYLLQMFKGKQIEPFYFYCFAETIIGIGGLVVPKLFLSGHNWLLAFGQTNSLGYLVLSAIILSLIMLPWCFFMGTTIPFLVDYINRKIVKDKHIFSFIYLANTLGAMTGLMITAIFLIEFFGFRKTLFVASSANFLIALTGLWIIVHLKSVSTQTDYAQKINYAESPSSKTKNWFVLGLLFTTGFSSVGFEVVWNRLFTPILGTSVYAFASILFIYLLGTCLGLLHYRFHLQKNNIFSTKFLLLLLSGISILQLWFVDPRINFGIWGVILCIGALAYVLGYLTPKQVDELSEGNPHIISFAYAINLSGCILGPLLTAYLLIPLFGAKFSLILLSLPLLAFLLNQKNVVYQNFLELRRIFFFFSILIITTAGLGTTYEEWLDVPQKKIKNDYNATVLAATLEENNPRSKYLMVNGVGMTMLTPITKVMAHLPLFALPENPQRALAICFGMGTTFRSMISWGIPTTGVELTPSVVEFFPYFFDDANKILSQKNNQIVIDDGRRFLQRTSEKYDLISIDPPPPVEAAGSSLLYSEEFYAIIKSRLTENGILAHWYPEKNDSTLQAVARSLVNIFPYVEVYASSGGNGYHFLASNNPIVIPSLEQIIQKMPIAAQTDLMEWNDTNEPNLSSYIQKILSGKQNINKLLNKNENIKITDDQPYNEYFIWH